MLPLPDYIADHGYEFFPKRDEITRQECKFFVIHHTATRPDATPAEIAAEALRRRWAGSYNFLWYPDGSIHTISRFPNRGTHALGVNDRSFGGAFVGTYTNRVPTEAAILSSYRTMAFVESQAGYRFRVIGHCEVAGLLNDPSLSTECPGAAIRNRWTEYLIGYEAFKGGIPMTSAIVKKGGSVDIDERKFTHVFPVVVGGVVYLVGLYDYGGELKKQVIAIEGPRLA